jgi:adenine-specific DNA glycosylase
MRGIGPYTASAVLTIVYGQAEPLVDVNMPRQAPTLS